MIKVRVIKPFYYAKNKELYLEESRFRELEKLGLVEPVEEVQFTTSASPNRKLELDKAEKSTNDKTRVLSN